MRSGPRVTMLESVREYVVDRDTLGHSRAIGDTERELRLANA